MTTSKRHQVSVPFWAAISVLFAWGVLFFMLASALTRLYITDPRGLLAVLLLLSEEFGKAVFVGSSAGILLKYLLDEYDQTPRTSMFDCGISRLYPTRVDARATFKSAIEDRDDVLTVVEI
jgi:hypothetical protein